MSVSLKNFLHLVGLNGLAVGVKLVTLLGLSKLLAVMVGPAGLATVGQLQNLLQVSTMLGSGSIGTGVTKLTAAKDSTHYRAKVLLSSAYIVAACSAGVALLLVLFADVISILIFSDPKLTWLVRLVSVGTFFSAFNLLILAYLNGCGDNRGYVIANIVGSLISLLLIAPAIQLFGVSGALASLCLYQGLSVGASGWIARNHLSNALHSGVTIKIRSWLKRLAPFALMAATSAVCIPLSHILIRYYLTDSFGVEFAGYWEAILRVSSAYLMLITLTLSLYFVPRFSQLRDWAAASTEIRLGSFTMLPMMVTLCLTLYWSNNWVVTLLLTEDFLPMAHLLPWQAMGDTLKVGALIVAYLMLGKTMTRLYVVSEIVTSSFFIIAVIFACQEFGFDGVVYAHIATYLFYWPIIYLYIRKNMRALYG